MPAFRACISYDSFLWCFTRSPSRPFDIEGVFRVPEKCITPRLPYAHVKGVAAQLGTRPQSPSQAGSHDTNRGTWLSTTHHVRYTYLYGWLATAVPLRPPRMHLTPCTLAYLSWRSRIAARACSHQFLFADAACLPAW